MPSPYLLPNIIVPKNTHCHLNRLPLTCDESALEQHQQHRDRRRGGGEEDWGQRPVTLHQLQEKTSSSAATELITTNNDNISLYLHLPTSTLPDSGPKTAQRPFRARRGGDVVREQREVELQTRGLL